MAQATDIRAFDKGMNKDVEPRFLKPGEYIHALNLVNNNYEDGRVGGLTNLPGIEAVVGAGLIGFHVGDRIVHMLRDSQNDEIYLFIAGGNVTTSPDRIVKYSTVTDSFEAVVITNNLGFSSSLLSEIKTAAISEGIIVWTQEGSDIKMFDTNVDYLAQLGIEEFDVSTSYSLFSKVKYENIVYECGTSTTAPNTGDEIPSGTLESTTNWDIVPNSDITSDMLKLAQVAPRDKPHISVYTDTSFKSNNIKGKFFQFKYRFIFANNNKSTFSPISEIAYSENDYASPELSQDSVFKNAVSINIKDSGSNALVTEIEIAARQGNFGDFMSIATVDATDLKANGEYTYNFYNNGLYHTISLNESNQIYSDVPREGGCVEIINNRVVIGDCKTGYDKISVDIDISKVFDPAPDTATAFSGDTSADPDPDGVLQSVAGLQGFFDGIGYIPAVGDTIEFIGESPSYNRFGEVKIVVASGWGTQEIFDAINSYTFSIGSRNDAIISDYWVEDGYGDDRDEIYTNEYYSYNIYQGAANHRPILKSGAFYNIGFQYFDAEGRTNGSLYNVEDKVYIPTLGERNLAPGDTDKVGAANLVITINHPAPDWAVYYSIVYNRTSSMSQSVCTVVEEATLGTTLTEEVPIPAGAKRLSLSPLYDYIEKNKDATTLAYDWEKGDRVRFRTKGYSAAAADDDWVDDVYDHEIIQAGLDYGFSLTGTATDSYQWVDIYASGITQAEMEDAQIEIYKPGRDLDPDESIFYESKYIYPVTSGSHHGLVNQDGVAKTGGSAFQMKGGSAPKVDYIYVKLADADGFPASNIQDGGSPEITISNAVLDQSVVPIWVAGSYANNTVVQLNGWLYKNLSGGSTSETCPGDGTDGTDWFTNTSLNGTNDIEFVEVVGKDHFLISMGAGDLDLSFLAIWDTVALESADITYDSNSKGLVIIDEADAYQVVRSMQLNGVDTSVICETFHISDYDSNSKQAMIGRPSASIDQSESNRIATLMYSEPYIPNSNINNVNRFYPDVNFEEYTKAFGKIILIHNEGDHLLMIQQDKTSQVYVDKSVTYDAQGNASLLGTQARVLSDSVPYKGTYGIHDPRSFQTFSGNRYWLDPYRGAVLRLSNSGIDRISDNGMRGHFSSLCKNMLNTSSKYVSSMMDIAHESYMIFITGDSAMPIWDEGSNAWIGFQSRFLPDHSTYINNRVFYTYTGLMYELNIDTVANNTIGGGTPVESSIIVPCNVNPAEDKNFLGLSIDGSHSLDVLIETEGIGNVPNQESSLLRDYDFTQRETEWDASFMRDENTPNVTNPLLEGDTMKGKNAVITLTLPVAVADEDFSMKLIKVIVSRG